MVYHITVQGGHKVAVPVKSEEEYRQLRGTSEQQKNLQLARQGDEDAKKSLVQFNYSAHFPDGVVAGCKMPNYFFSIDVDEPAEFERISKTLLANPEQWNLLMLERSARQGGHAIFKRTNGLTILECQVRLAQKLECEMDTNAHDLCRVFFSTTDSPDELLYLSPKLFEDNYNEEAVRAEAELLKEREANGLEILPPGAHNSNKHYRVPKDWNPEAPEVTVTKEDSVQKPSNQIEGYYKGLKFSEIIDTYWK